MDLPLADSPVSQMVRPFWERSWERSARERPACQVMLLLWLLVVVVIEGCEGHLHRFD